MLQTVARALRLLALFTPERPEWAVSDLARALGVSKSMVARLLETLREHGYVVQDPVTRRYRLGLNVVGLVRAAQAGFALHRVALPVMQQLTAETGETSFLTVVEDEQVVVLERVEGSHPLKYTLAVGARAPLHAGASNKVLLAFLPEPQREAYLSRPLARYTERTLTDPDRLREVLARIRQEGYDHSAGELSPGASAVAAPVFGRDGGVVGAVSVVGPELRFGPDRLPWLVERVKAAARDVTGRL